LHTRTDPVSETRATVNVTDRPLVRQLCPHPCQRRRSSRIKDAGLVHQGSSRPRQWWRPYASMMQASCIKGPRLGAKDAGLMHQGSAPRHAMTPATCVNDTPASFNAARFACKERPDPRQRMPQPGRTSARLVIKRCGGPREESPRMHLPAPLLAALRLGGPSPSRIIDRPPVSGAQPPQVQKGRAGQGEARKAWTRREQRPGREGCDPDSFARRRARGPTMPGPEEPRRQARGARRRDCDRACSEASTFS
jgi:hypothetical protein